MTSEEYDKLSAEEKRIKVAELRGWCRFSGKGTDRLGGQHISWGMPSDDCLIPDYLNDLNACHEFETRLSSKTDFTNRLIRIMETGQPLDMVHATAEQRCKAFVLTMEVA